MLVAGYFALMITLAVAPLSAVRLCDPGAQQGRATDCGADSMIAAPLLFVAGVGSRTSPILPPAIHFLQGYNSTEFQVPVQAGSYYKFEIMLMMGIGLAFQVPLLALALAERGSHQRKHSYAQLALRYGPDRGDRRRAPGGGPGDHDDGDPATRRPLCPEYRATEIGRISQPTARPRRRGQRRQGCQRCRRLIQRELSPLPLRIPPPMLFDLRSRKRRGAVRVIYLLLAVVMVVGLVGLGIGTGSTGGLLNAGGNGGSSNGNSLNNAQLRSAIKAVSKDPSAANWAALMAARCSAAGNGFDNTTGVYSAAAKAQLRKAPTRGSSTSRSAAASRR